MKVADAVKSWLLKTIQYQKTATYMRRGGELGNMVMRDFMSRGCDGWTRGPSGGYWRARLLSVDRIMDT